MAQADLDDLKQLLTLLIQQVDALTTQTTELMPLKNVTQGFRDEERKISASLITRRNTLRQLAGTVLSMPDQSEVK